MKEDAPAMSTLHMQELSSSLTPEHFDDTNYTKWCLNEENKIRAENIWPSFLAKKLHQKIKILKIMKPAVWLTTVSVACRHICRVSGRVGIVLARNRRENGLGAVRVGVWTLKSAKVGF
uniref:Uncharacterized protein n=1 Tax=Ananas comosus var. bracteatus TaxID=296719 RepID=A0A6V7PQ06_ANACO|nr:unnamed protein product [Ananas comosus var. bracteatus]